MLNEVLIAAVRFEFSAPYIETIPINRTAPRTYGWPRKDQRLRRTMSSDPPTHAVQFGQFVSAAAGTFPRIAMKNPA